MKKILSTVLVCVLLLGCVFALASCGAKPNADPEKAEAALKDAGYEVHAMIKDGVGFISATKLDVDLEEIKSEEDYMKALEDAEVVYIVYLAEDADEEAINEAYEELKEELEDAKEEVDIDLEIGKSGNVLWYGTKKAIKAAK